jgi:putative MATE family efflux protein
MKYSNIDLMERAPVLTARVRLAVPTILGIIVQLVYNITDTYFIGLLDDYNQIAAVSLAMPVMFITGALSHIFSAGAPSYISRLLGRKEYEMVKRTSSFAFYTTVALGVPVAAVMLINLKPILLLIGASKATYDYTHDYVFIILLFCVIGMGSGTMQGLLRSEGAAKLAAIGMVIGAVANIILDPVFILGFNMGIKGAAIATIMGQSASSIFFVINLCKKNSYVSIDPRYYRPDKRMVKEVLSIGVPSSLSQILLSTTIILSNTIAVGYGDYVIAASGIASNAQMTFIMLIMGISMGMQPFIGYNYGSKNYRRMFSGIRSCIFLGTGICLIFVLLIGFFSRWFMRQFSSDVQVLTIGTRIMRLGMIGLPFMALQLTFMTYLQSTGQSAKAMIVNLSRQCLILIPVIYIMNYFFGLTGFLLASPISDLASVVLAVCLVVPGMLKIAKYVLTRFSENP